MKTILSFELLLAPSNCTMNSVFIYLLVSLSLSEREHSKESISSKNMTLGYRCAARVNNALTVFSPSPTYLDVRVDALTLKNVALPSEAIALPIIVLPVPGGPKRSRPLPGEMIPSNSFGFSRGHRAISTT